MSNARLLADYVSSGDELANLVPQSIVQTDARDLTGTYSTHEMIVGNTFTLTGNVTVNENIVLANFTKSVTDVTVQPDATARTITSTGGTGVLEGGSLMSQSTQLNQWLYEE